jgi:hypothetical protein
MSSTPTLLVYDDAIETSEVLAAVYQPRGFEVRRLASPPTAADGREPGSAVVVLSSAGESAARTNGPLKVLIGRAHEEPLHAGARLVSTCRLSSLFDYGELVSAIDRLLCGTD